MATLIVEWLFEAFHSKRDTFERDIIIGGFFSFSPVVNFVVWIYTW